MVSIYNIPANHMGGTFWYHPHFYGRTAYGTIGGAFGMIIIDEQPTIGFDVKGAALGAPRQGNFDECSTLPCFCDQLSHQPQFGAKAGGIQ